MKKFEFGKSFGKSLKDKKFKYGGYATLFTSIILIILVVVNIVVGKLDIKFDMTKTKLYSLSDSSTKIIGNLKQDVTIYGLYESGKEEKSVTEVLEKYKAKSSKITLEYKDPVKYPTFVQQYSTTGTTITTGSVIVVSGSKFKVIDSAELFGTTQDQTTGSSTITSSQVEQKISSALIYVSSSKSSVIANLQGHQEVALPAEITSELTNENYTVKDTNLAAAETTIDKDAMLLINAPQIDITAAELPKIKDFLSKGGKAVVVLDPSINAMPNLTEVLSYLGVKGENDFVVEGDASHVASNSANVLLPDLESQTITSPIITAKLPVIVPNSQSFATLKVKRSTVTIEPLLVTSASAYGKLNLKNLTTAKEASDIKGPLIVAMAITDKSSDGNTANDGRTVVIGTSKIMDSSVITASNKGNVNFIMNSINWAVGNRDNISILPKDMAADNLTINAMQIIIASCFVIVVIPLIVVITGIVVWVRRRHL